MVTPIATRGVSQATPAPLPIGRVVADLQNGIDVFVKRNGNPPQFADSKKIQPHLLPKNSVAREDYLGKKQNAVDGLAPPTSWKLHFEGQTIYVVDGAISDTGWETNYYDHKGALLTRLYQGQGEVVKNGHLDWSPAIPLK